MNGVRRFLGNATSPPTSMPANRDHIGISSRSPSPTKELPPPPPITKGLFIRKDRKPPPPPISGPSSTESSPTISTPPLRRKAPPAEWEETSPPSNGQASGEKPANTRDALLLSLLSSEAIVDSRAYEILSAEEVEDLKKVSAVFDIKLRRRSEEGGFVAKSSASRASIVTIALWPDHPLSTVRCDADTGALP
jgi:hypothetical protein